MLRHTAAKPLRISCGMIEEASVTQQAISFVLGIVAPVALVSWLLILH